MSEIIEIISDSSKETVVVETPVTRRLDVYTPGPAGPTGPQGPSNVLDIGTVGSGATADATITGTSPSQTLNLVLPIGPQGVQGPQGFTGPPNVLNIGTVSGGAQADATITGTSPSQTLSLTLPTGPQGPQGYQGAQGPQGFTGPQGPQGAVGPQGAQGVQGVVGPQGSAATVNVGTTTTGSPGSQAAVTNSGTTSAAVFDFTVPQGPQGVQGPQGIRGVQIASSAPVDTGILWADTSDPGDAAIPAGGTTGQVLAKISGSNYDTGWISSGVPAGGTTGQVLVKNSNANYDDGWASVGSAARPFLTGGAYLSGSGLVLSGIASNYATTPDSNALDITGDLDVRMYVAFADWTPGTVNYPMGKWGAAGQRSWYLQLNINGRPALIWSNDGTASITATATVAPTVNDGDYLWIRAVLDVDNAGVYNVLFYTSADGTTWTQLGTTVVGGTTTSVFASTASLFMGTLDSSSTVSNCTIRRVQIRNGIDGTVAFDANFETATADALAFTESSANAATVTINTTRYSYGVPNFTLVSIATISNFIPANTDRYTFFLVNSSTIIDLVSFEVTTGPASNATVYYAIYAADNNFQPTGSPLFTDSQSVTASATGTFTKQLASAATLAPGLYAVGWNSTQNISVRAIRGGITAFSLPSISNTPTFDFVQIARTAATFPSNPAAWTVRNGGVSTALSHPFLFRWKAAS